MHKKLLLLLLLILSATAALYSAENEYIWMKWTHQIKDIDFHPNSQIFATGGVGGEVKIWDLEGNEIKKLIAAYGGEVPDIEFSHNGKYLAASCGSGMVIWNTEDWSLLKNRQYIFSECPHQLSFSYDDKNIIAALDYRGILKYDIENDKIDTIISLKGEQSLFFYYGAQYTNDGKYILVRGVIDHLTSTEGFRHLYSTVDYSLISNNYVSWSAISNDGKYLAETLSDRTNIREVETKSIVLSLPMEITIGNFYKVKFSPNDNFILTGGSDRKLNIWNIETGENIRYYQTDPPYGIFGIAISKDSQYIAASSGGNILLLYKAKWTTNSVSNKTEIARITKTYPNPANDKIIIELLIVKETNIKITISDDNGKSLQTLYDGPIEAGGQNIRWDIASYPSGVYFIQLTSNGTIDTKKQIIEK